MTEQGCNALHPFVDGELTAAEADAYRDHLAGCTACQARLPEVMAMIGLLETSGDSHRDDKPLTMSPGEKLTSNTGDAHAPEREPSVRDPIRIESARSRRWPGKRTLGIAIVIAAAAAAIFLVPRLLGSDGGGSDASDESEIALATAPTRSFEGRISYRGAASYRPYNIARAGDQPHPTERISHDTLARLERRGDFHGLAAAELLLGNPDRALAEIERAGAGADVASDRALALLAQSKLAEALVALDAILERAPRHPQALWNRALTLRDLRLPLMAAEAFKAVAALNEPGWSDEARRLAQMLDDIARGHEAAVKQLAGIDGPRLAVAPDAVTAETARRFPGSARLFFYEAVRGAESAEIVRRLAPLGRELDALAGGDHLARYVEHTLKADFTRRGPLAARYAKLVAGERLEPAAGRAFVAELRAAGQNDLLLGALIHASGDGTVPEALLPEYRRLANATGDPWFDLLTTEQEANALIRHGQRERAEVILLRALASCAQSGLDYRCGKLELLLGRSYLLMMRLSDARRVLLAALARARAIGEWYLEQNLLPELANLEALSDELGGRALAIARGYVGEYARREPEHCDIAAWGPNLLAGMLADRQDFEGVRVELQRAASAAHGCANARVTSYEVATKAHLLRDGPSALASEIDELRATIATLRTTADAAERAFYDQVEGRLLIDHDRAAATALLERAIADTRAAKPTDLMEHKTRSYAYSILITDAGRAGEWDRVWRLFGDEAGFTPREQCTLGIAVEGRRSVIVVRDANGAVHGSFDSSRKGPTQDLSQLVRAQLREKLDACRELEVVARPPIHGTPGLFGTDLAWSYRSGRGERPASAPGRTHLVISNAEPPAGLGMPRLRPWRSTSAEVRTLAGPGATPSRALSELADAGYVEIHAHGMVNPAVSDASFLMMSPEPDGRYELTAAMIRKQALRGRPLVILAACHAAQTAAYTHQPWTLPAAFIEAGARGVIASPEIIDDADAGVFFDRLRTRLERGESPSIALRDARKEWLIEHPTATWVRSLMVFH